MHVTYNLNSRPNGIYVTTCFVNITNCVITSPGNSDQNVASGCEDDKANALFWFQIQHKIQNSKIQHKYFFKVIKIARVFKNKIKNMN